jgi:DNA helicase IV
MSNVLNDGFMPDNRKKKVVQTELEVSDYEVLLNSARRKNMTIKEAAREALRSWAASTTDLTEDPLFKLKPIEFKVKVKSNEIEAFLYNRKKK